MPVQSSLTSAIYSTFPLHSSVPACSFGKSTSCMKMFDQQFRPSQFKPSFFISECGRIHRYAVVQVQHGHKINLSAPFKILNGVKTPATWEKVQSYSLKWAVYRLRLSLKTLNFAAKTALASVRNFNLLLQSSAQLCVFHAWLRFWLT